MEMPDRRANLLETLERLCRDKKRLEDEKADAASDFNGAIKEVQSTIDKVLEALSKGADPTELPFEDPPAGGEEFEESPPYTEEEIEGTKNYEPSITIDDEAEEEPEDIDAGNFFG
jgi:hypothetical protein